MANKNNWIKDVIINVHDGDTITGNTGNKNYRIHGIDTPEVGTKEPLQKEWADKARDFVAALLLNKDVWIDNKYIKSYNREVARINYGVNQPVLVDSDSSKSYLKGGDFDLGLTLVKAGLARVAYLQTDVPTENFYTTSVQYLAELSAAESYAQFRGVGIWSGVDLDKVFPGKNIVNRFQKTISQLPGVKVDFNKNPMFKVPTVHGEAITGEDYVDNWDIVSKWLLQMDHGMYSVTEYFRTFEARMKSLLISQDKAVILGTEHVDIDMANWDPTKVIGSATPFRDLFGLAGVTKRYESTGLEIAGVNFNSSTNPLAEGSMFIIKPTYLNLDPVTLALTGGILAGVTNSFVFTNGKIELVMDGVTTGLWQIALLTNITTGTSTFKDKTSVDTQLSAAYSKAESDKKYIAESKLTDGSLSSTLLTNKDKGVWATGISANTNMFPSDPKPVMILTKGFDMTSTVPKPVSPSPSMLMLTDSQIRATAQKGANSIDSVIDAVGIVNVPRESLLNTNNTIKPNLVGKIAQIKRAVSGLPGPERSNIEWELIDLPSGTKKITTIREKDIFASAPNAGDTVTAVVSDPIGDGSYDVYEFTNKETLSNQAIYAVSKTHFSGGNHVTEYFWAECNDNETADVTMGEYQELNGTATGNEMVLWKSVKDRLVDKTKTFTGGADSSDARNRQVAAPNNPAILWDFIVRDDGELALQGTGEINGTPVQLGFGTFDTGAGDKEVALLYTTIDSQGQTKENFISLSDLHNPGLGIAISKDNERFREGVTEEFLKEILNKPGEALEMWTRDTDGIYTINNDWQTNGSILGSMMKNIELITGAIKLSASKSNGKTDKFELEANNISFGGTTLSNIGQAKVSNDAVTLGQLNNRVRTHTDGTASTVKVEDEILSDMGTNEKFVAEQVGSSAVWRPNSISIVLPETNSKGNVVDYTKVNYLELQLSQKWKTGTFEGIDNLPQFTFKQKSAGATEFICVGGDYTTLKFRDKGEWIFVWEIDFVASTRTVNINFSDGTQTPVDIDSSEVFLTVNRVWAIEEEVSTGGATVDPNRLFTEGTENRRSILSVDNTTDIDFNVSDDINDKSGPSISLIAPNSKIGIIANEKAKGPLLKLADSRAGATKEATFEKIIDAANNSGGGGSVDPTTAKIYSLKNKAFSKDSLGYWELDVPNTPVSLQKAASIGFRVRSARFDMSISGVQRSISIHSHHPIVVYPRGDNSYMYPKVEIFDGLWPDVKYVELVLQFQPQSDNITFIPTAKIIKIYDTNNEVQVMTDVDFSVTNLNVEMVDVLYVEGDKTVTPAPKRGGN